MGFLREFRGSGHLSSGVLGTLLSRDGRLPFPCSPVIMGGRCGCMFDWDAVVDSHRAGVVKVSNWPVVVGRFQKYTLP